MDPVNSNSSRPTPASRIAVAIPAWRASGTIVETLESLQSQNSLESIGEVLIIDDGSDDNLESIARGCWDNEIPLNIEILAKNHGQWHVTNRLFDQLKAYPWVAIVHADDVLLPGWLDALLLSTSLAAPEVATVFTSYNCWYPSENRLIAGEDFDDPRILWLEGSEKSLAGALLNGCWWHISGSAVSSRAFASVGAFDENFTYSADWEWLLRLLADGWAVGYYRESLLKYRIHAASVSSRSFSEGIDIREAFILTERYAGRSSLLAGEVSALYRKYLFLCARRVLTRLARGHFYGARKHLGLLIRNFPGR